jgi:hypothetical protein
MKFSIVFILFCSKDYEKSLNELKSLNTFKFEMNEKRFEKLKKMEDYFTETQENLKKTVDGMIFR